MVSGVRVRVTVGTAVPKGPTKSRPDAARSRPDTSLTLPGAVQMPPGSVEIRILA